MLCLRLSVLKMDEIYKTEDGLAVRTIYIPDVSIHVSAVFLLERRKRNSQGGVMLIEFSRFHGDFHTIPINQMRCDY